MMNNQGGRHPHQQSDGRQPMQQQHQQAYMQQQQQVPMRYQQQPQQQNYQQQPPQTPQQGPPMTQSPTPQQLQQPTAMATPVKNQQGSPMSQQVMYQQQQQYSHTPTGMAPPQQQQQQQQPSEQDPQQEVPSSAEKFGFEKFKTFFHKEEQGPKLGFQPSAAMAQRHEEALVSGKRPRFQFQVTKLRSWRTGYVRLLCLYNDHFSTFDPDSHQVTNTWNYDALKDYCAMDKDQILLQVNADKLKFQCHNVERSMVLTALLQCREDHMKAHIEKQIPEVLCNRYTRHGTVVASALKVTSYAVIEIHPASKERLQAYRFVDIVCISFTSDDPSGILLYLNSKKLRLFSITSKSRADVVNWMRQSYDRIGLDLRMTDSCSISQWKEKKHEFQKRADAIATEYKVTKNSKRHDVAAVGSPNGWPGGTVNRKLCITGTGRVLEKDSAGMIVSSYPLSELYALVRPSTAGDTIVLEFADGHSRTYSSPCRDSLLVSLIDAASTLGKNPQVHVSDVPSGGYCLASFATSAVPEKSGGLFQPISIPVHCLKRVHTVATAAFSYVNSNTESSTQEGAPLNPIEECRNVMELCREFNASVLPTSEGLPTGERDKFVLGSIGALWGLAADLLEMETDRYMAEHTAGPMFQTLHRLSKTPAGYKNSIELATFLDCLPLLWSIEDTFCKFWAFRALRVLLSGLSGKKPRDKEVEYVNKSVIFKTGGNQLINGLVSSLLSSDASDLIRMGMSDILQCVLCSFADTTSPENFSSFIQALGGGYQALLSTLYQQTPFVIENSALLLHLLSTHAPTVAASIRDSALSTAILLHHFHAAIFSPLEGQRFLSRFLCSLWLAGPVECDEKKLLKRIVPSGFMGYLKMPQLSREEEEQLDQLERDTVEENIPEKAEEQPEAIKRAANLSGAAGTNTARLRARIAIARIASKHQEERRQLPENFRIFFHVLTQNHALPDLIWNQQTRRELRIGLESEIQYIQRETEARGIHKIAWNHQQFGIEYPSLQNELRVGSVYMRLWLQAGEGFIKSWDKPIRLFELLFRRFLCEMDRDTKVTIMCIRCLERLYSIHGSTIGAFPDVMILIRSMASTRSIETQHRLLGLLATILGVQKDENGDENRANIPENAEQLLNAESIKQLCHFVAWGHTNGVQVGNLMTSVLGSGYSHSGLAMLTNGNSMCPEGEGGNVDPSTTAPDIKCPALWFVSSSGRVPPPAESIRGPFRVSELQKMMEVGDISPFTLVTSTKVESYDDEEEDEKLALIEAHIDTGKWNRLDGVWQLRWQLCTDSSGTGIFSPAEVSIQAMRSLTRLVDLHKSLDSRGLPFYPIPIAKRIMCGLTREPAKSDGGATLDSFLSIIAQSILCNDTMLVDQAAELLFKLTQYNEEATVKFYLTGVYFFTACYTGSNFKSLAKLLHSTHLNQHFRSGFAAAADNSELSLKERSILGGMLPEGVLFILFNYGTDRFNDVFVGNFDTPEVIWNFEMRKHLIEMVLQHLGDFPKRLWQNTTTRYEYCPMPGVAYKRLEKEIFCHNYYLRNLCDEVRFPDWPIAEPVQVFRACLEEFKNQMNRDETKEEKALESASKVLNLKAGDGSRELRKSYRTMARKYHPDKNPSGREMFEAIQEAYELLLPVIESGQKIQTHIDHDDESHIEHTSQDRDSNVAEGFVGGSEQMESMKLLIRTQSLICRRFENEMSQYKYPAYQILLTCLHLPASCQVSRSQLDSTSVLRSPLMQAKRAEFIRDAVELLFRTCLVSPLNAEELVAEGGASVLESLLDFYVHASKSLDGRSVSGSSSASDKTVSDILSNVVHTMAGIAFYENGRNAIASLEDCDRFCVNWRRCLDGKFLGAAMRQVGDSLIKKFVLEGVASMARHGDLQRVLIGSGIVWPLGRYLLGFDPTLDEASMAREGVDDDIGISQAASNSHARLAVRALGMLCGTLLDKAYSTPKNLDLQRAVNVMLTKPVALLLRNKRTGEILRTLNTNVQTPSRIWNVEMRNDLLKFLDKMEAKHPEGEIVSVEKELKGFESFEYRALKDELRIGGVYVRIFNQLGLENGALRDINNPGLFALQLSEFIARCLNASDAFPETWVRLRAASNPAISDDSDFSEPQLGCVSISDRRFVATLTALRVLVRIDGLVDDVLCDNNTHMSSVLLSLLELPQDTEAFEMGCEILSILSPKQRFADSAAMQGSLWRLLSVLERCSSQEDQLQDSTTNAGRHLDILRKQRGWALLESLSSSPSVAQKLIESTAWLELLGILVGYSGFTKVWIARIGAAKTLSRLLWDPKTGSILGPLLQRFLPTTLVVVLKEEGPDTMVNLFDGESDTPELIWNGSMRVELRQAIAEQLDACIDERLQGVTGEGRFTLKPDIQVKYKDLQGELFVGGVYVSKFLKEPTYNVRDPTAFLEMLLQRWTHEMKLFTSRELGTQQKSTTEIALGANDSLQSITDASVYLCKVRTNLCDKLSNWGYMGRCLTFLDTVLTQELVGTPLLSVMRVLHVAVTRRQNVEALIMSGQNDRLHGIVSFTKKAVGHDGLHQDAAFMIDMLRRLFIEALGDLKSASNVKVSTPAPLPTQYQAPYNPEHVYMAPSPAPGEGPVSRNHVTIGNPLDDPLAFAAAPAGNQATQHQGMRGYQAQYQNSGTAYVAQQMPSHLAYQQQGAAITAGAQAPLGYGSNQGTISNQTQPGYSSGLQQTIPTSSATQSTHYIDGSTFLPSRVQQQYQPSFPTRSTPVAHGYPQQSASPGTSRFQQAYVSPLQNSQYAPQSMSSHQGQAAQQPHLVQPPRPSAQQPLRYDSGQGSHQHPAPVPHAQQQPRAMHQYSQQQIHGIPQGQRIGSFQAQQPFDNANRAQPMQRGEPGPRMPHQVLQQGEFQGIVDPRFHQHAAQPNGQVQTNQPQFAQRMQPTQVRPPPPQQLPPPPPQEPPSQLQYQEQPIMAAANATSFNVGDEVMTRTTPSPGMHRNVTTPGSRLEQPQQNEGAGIDARTKLDPKEEAEMKMTTCPAAPDAADGRFALLQSALACELPKFLVEDVLENPKLSNVKDPAATKVHAVELLKLLTSDPGYGMKFEMILDAIPSWKKYKKQDHSLFMTSSEKTMVDYFLTDGSGSKDQKKLLTEG